jgi:hypothetical protein
MSHADPGDTIGIMPRYTRENRSNKFPPQYARSLEVEQLPRGRAKRSGVGGVAASAKESDARRARVQPGSQAAVRACQLSVRGCKIPGPVRKGNRPVCKFLRGDCKGNEGTYKFLRGLCKRDRSLWKGKPLGHTEFVGGEGAGRST